MRDLSLVFHIAVSYPWHVHISVVFLGVSFLILVVYGIYGLEFFRLTSIESIAVYKSLVTV